MLQWCQLLFISGTPASVASSSSASAATTSAASNADAVNFISGNPFVEVTKGVLHLYKENQTTSLEEGVIRSQMICKENKALF